MSGDVIIPRGSALKLRDALRNKAAHDWANFVNEALDAAPTPDYQEMVARLVEAIGLYTMAGFTATADAHGTDAAILALESAAPCVAPPVDDRAAWLAMLREAVRVEDITVHATLYTSANPTTGRREVVEVEPLLPVLAVPRQRELVELTSGRVGHVVAPPTHRGRAVLLELELVRDIEGDGF